MSREIKFRAWDGTKFGYVTLHPRSIHVPQSDYWPRSGYSADHISFLNLEDWQQNTGLKDKNGKEIYEGDIVKNTWNSSEQIGTVVILPRGIRLSHTDCLTGEGFTSDLWIDREMEIIGNIYENPDLLKK